MIGELPLWLKLSFTAFVAVLVPVYALRAAAGPKNFLWFSDIALIGACVAMWLESSLLASMMALAVLLPELVWNTSFLSRLLTGRSIAGIAEYMFDAREHWYMRALSLFHVFLPVALIWLVAALGYDERAFYYQTIVAWLVLPLTYAFTDPLHNINRVFGLGARAQVRVHPLAYLGVLMIALPVIVYVPSHLLLRALFTR